MLQTAELLHRALAVKPGPIFFCGAFGASYRWPVRDNLCAGIMLRSLVLMGSARSVRLGQPGVAECDNMTAWLHLFDWLYA
jgi:hypothetical protein